MPKLLVASQIVSLAQLLLFTAVRFQIVGSRSSTCFLPSLPAACQPPPSCTLPPPASCFPCGVPTQLLSPSPCPPTSRQVRTSSAVFEDFGFGPGVRPALAGFLLFQQLIGPADEVRAGGGWLGLVADAAGMHGNCLYNSSHKGNRITNALSHTSSCRCWACCPTWSPVSD